MLLISDCSRYERAIRESPGNQDRYSPSALDANGAHIVNASTDINNFVAL
jgi:hypothetical protein